MAKTTTRMDARERARKARLRVDAEREERDRKIETAAADYFTAADQHADVAQQLAEIEVRMHDAVRDLLDLRESPARIASLLGIEARTVRRIRAEQGASSDLATSESSGTEEEPLESQEVVV